jgi:bacterioferritin-associated ferredoxin
MIVCLCEGVSSREIELAVKDGAQRLEEVAESCHAGIGCGACHEQILEIVKAMKMLEHNRPCDIAAEGVFKNV